MQTVQWMSEEIIASKAGDLRTDTDQTVAPIDPVKIADKKGVSVRTATFSDENISGMLRWVDGAPEILVAESHGYRRQRYSIAHEIGHFMLHFSEHREFVDTQLDFFRRTGDSEEHPSKRREEIQANIFAAELLMPRSLVIKAYSVSPHIESLADTFLVSRLAMEIRIANLDL